MIQHLEELSLSAWPALRSVYHDGWICRLANGYTRRSNSVHPLYTGQKSLDAKAAFAESFYRGHHQRAIFKMTDASMPSDLDRYLAARRYNEEARTSVEIADLTPQLTGDDAVKTWTNVDSE